MLVRREHVSREDPLSKGRRKPLPMGLDPRATDASPNGKGTIPPNMHTFSNLFTNYLTGIPESIIMRGAFSPSLFDKGHWHVEEVAFAVGFRVRSRRGRRDAPRRLARPGPDHVLLDHGRCGQSARRRQRHVEQRRAQLGNEPQRQQPHRLDRRQPRTPPTSTPTAAQRPRSPSPATSSSATSPSTARATPSAEPARSPFRAALPPTRTPRSAASSAAAASSKAGPANSPGVPRTTPSPARSKSPRARSTSATGLGGPASSAATPGGPGRWTRARSWRWE